MTTFPASSAEEELLARLAARLADLDARLAAAGRSRETVRLVAVTKARPVAYVRAAAALGLGVVGENYVDELESKHAAAAELDLRWHYLGALQSNKIGRVLAAADVVCALAREREVDLIARRRAGATVYVEVDFTGVPGRPGAQPQDVAALVAHARSAGLDVAGLMSVAPPPPAPARAVFDATRALADELGLAERSMGMSDDLEDALAAGSTEIRVGTALFGPRDAAPGLA